MLQGGPDKSTIMSGDFNIALLNDCLMQIKTDKDIEDLNHTISSIHTCI